MSAVETKLNAMGYELPALPTPAGNYVPFKRIGDMLYLSGQGPRKPDGTSHTGKVGAEVDVATAYGHARIIGLQLLAVAKAAVGDLDRIEFVKLLGMVNAVPDFREHPKVINGCSDLFVELMGDRGRHARSAVGMGSLPNNITVEIEAIVRVHE